MITIVNASENNLKNISVNIPTNKLIVVTGVSGSGKSTLVYDVIYKEARRRYLETFSANARQFLGKLEQPNVQFMSGLRPPVALQQNTAMQSPRSTVGTLTEIYDLLRLLYARFASGSINEKLSRNHFSFNSPKGACPQCKGLGLEDKIDANSLIKDASKTIREGAFVMTTPSGYIVYSQVTMNVLNQVCNSEGFSVDIPWNELNEKQKNIVLYGSRKIKVPFGKHTLESRMKWSGITAKPRDEGYYKGIIPVMDEILKRDRNPNVLRFTKSQTCTVCNGSRLNSKVLNETYNGKNIAELASLPIYELEIFFASQVEKASGALKSIVDQILKLLHIVIKLGLGYLTLSRSSNTLSGGEIQRLRLAKLVCTQMRGVLYVFDEPSVGLNASETLNLLEVLYELKNNGNSVIVVEHNRHVIKNAEYIIDLGPDAGEKGGQLLFNGPLKEFLAQNNGNESKTLAYLKNTGNFKSKINTDNKELVINGACVNNLKNINATFKINALNVVTGVSGSGKKSLVNQTLAKLFLSNQANIGSNNYYKEISGIEFINDIQLIDQKPIGKTPRSNPATYTGLSDEIRNLFASLNEAKQNKYDRKHFSFNTKGGRCEKCEGAGYEQIGMHLLGNVEIVCSQCNGKQFKPEVLKVSYKGKSIANIYALTISQASEFFSDQPNILKYLDALVSVGLGYLKLNQRSSTLSGGEARRIKLAKNLVKISKKPTLYIIEEPASGLHEHDINVLLKNIDQLIEKGHTVVLIEQNLTIIKHADHLIELGPGSGAKGGEIIYQGNPEGILKLQNSNTAHAINERFNEINIETNVFDLFNPIEFRGVTTHNLKNIHIDIPVNKITTIIGVSGSGKSSLAFDTLFAEGQQRYAESFSSYVRNRLNINSQAKYESLKGLMPTIAVNRQSVSKSERSTVGTMTDIYDHIRLLYSRVGSNSETDTKLSASHFSFNHEHGACKCCEGLGYKMVADAEKLISNPELSLLNGAMQASKPGKFYGDIHGQYLAILEAVGAHYKVDFSKPWNALSAAEQNMAMYGTGSQQYQVNWRYKRKSREGEHKFESNWPGFLHYINEEYLRKANDKRKDALLPVMKKETCQICNGARLNSEALQYKILGLNIHEMCNIEVHDLLQECRKQVVVPNAFSTNELEQRAAQIICGSIINGLDILDKLGLGYLTLARAASTLSGGEGQRVRLAAGLAQDISGVCFILDEPTTGLHPKDLDNLYFMLHELKRQGNTIVVCEHDPGFIRYSDHVIELGPKGGVKGGNIVFEGSVSELLKHDNSITGKFLKSEYAFKRKKRNTNLNGIIKIHNAHANNLKNINVQIPTNAMVVIKGVSGSGKSSLMKQVLYNSYEFQKPQYCQLVEGFDNFNNVFLTDQHIPKGSSLSFIASYLDIYGLIKKEFVKAASKTPVNIIGTHFSLNSKAGKCQKCSGSGYIKTSMDFLSDVYEDCDECNGKRFNESVLAVTVNNCTIANVLEMPVNELGTFINNELVQKASTLLLKLGLGHLKTGQTLNTLSGGELQRLKLAKALLQSTDKPSLFLLDEPTSGLHMHDVEKLMNAFDELLTKGHSLVIIEHHKTVIDSADFVVELGPGAGDKGGELINAINFSNQ